MNYQRNLFGPTDTLDERFLEFHEANPDVYAELVKLCRNVKSRGRERWSINAAFEVLRYSRLQTRGDEFKLNNSHRALYARLIMENEPDLDGFFETRERSAA